MTLKSFLFFVLVLFLWTIVAIIVLFKLEQNALCFAHRFFFCVAYKKLENFSMNKKSQLKSRKYKFQSNVDVLLNQELNIASLD